MRFRTGLRTIGLVSCSLWMIGCGGPKSVLHDSTIPIPTIYDQAGQVLEGYEGYTKGYVSNMVKRCDAILDRLDRQQGR